MDIFMIATAVGLVLGGVTCFLFNDGQDDTDDAWEN